MEARLPNANLPEGSLWVTINPLRSKNLLGERLAIVCLPLFEVKVCKVHNTLDDPSKDDYQYDGHKTNNSHWLYRICAAVVTVTVLIPNSIRDFVKHGSYLIKNS
jgi:hypothetical protein